MTEQTKSRRADRRGHWPAGRRRNDLGSRVVLRLRTAIRRALNAPSQNPNRPGRSMSRKEIAALLEVDDKTIARWYSGEDHPAPEVAEKAIGALNAIARKQFGK